jgi:glucose-1-phosphate cytidylyltransferase
VPERRPQVVILCGGRGTRLREHTEAVPKPLVEIGGMPILWHLMKIYSEHGFCDFILCLGYKGNKIKDFFMNFHRRVDGDFVLDVRDGQPHVQGKSYALDDWRVTFVDTGLETNTGGRIKRVEPYLDGNTFFATYADGLADIDLAALLDFHRANGRIGTVTCVRPRSQFGIVTLDGDTVTQYEEKPVMTQWVSGGFFVFNRDIFQYLGDDDILERQPIERLCAEQQLAAYRLERFWACMDTYKDTQQLNDLWDSNRAPWKVWA